MLKLIQWFFILSAVTISLFCGVTISNADVTDDDIREQRQRELEESLEHIKGIETIKIAIEILQPYYKSNNPNRKRLLGKLATSIYWAASENEIDYRLAVALGSRESSLHPAIMSRDKHAVGYFQVKVPGAAYNQCANGCDQHDLSCNVDTAMCWLSVCKRQCGDNPWMYLGGYGRSRCPKSISVAKQWSELRSLRSKLCKGFGEIACNEILPI